MPKWLCLRSNHNSVIVKSDLKPVHRWKEKWWETIIPNPSSFGFGMRWSFSLNSIQIVNDPITKIQLSWNLVSGQPSGNPFFGGTRLLKQHMCIPSHLFSKRKMQTHKVFVLIRIMHVDSLTPTSLRTKLIQYLPWTSNFFWLGIVNSPICFFSELQQLERKLRLNCWWFHEIISIKQNENLIVYLIHDHARFWNWISWYTSVIFFDLYQTDVVHLSQSNNILLKLIHFTKKNSKLISPRNRESVFILHWSCKRSMYTSQYASDGIRYSRKSLEHRWYRYLERCSSWG